MTERSEQEHITGTDRTMMVDVPAELGPYRMSRMLGRGGMGEVWLALDLQLERDVAVKFMRKELLANEEAVKRFQREAKAVARLNHPNIVQVYSFGEQAGMVYFAMEMVEGETVTQRLKRVGALPLEEAVYILLQSIEGLSYANARGIVHRDIKPSNLMLTPDFRVKITDFGLAKMVEQDTQMTATGTSMGSPNYMSPEQARGQEADHRSDIYALGITFYQMLMNSLPFTADMPLTVLLKQIQEPLPEPPQLKLLQEGRVLNIIKRMVEKDPDARFQTYGGLAAAMAQLAPNVQVRSSTFTATASLPTPLEAAAVGASQSLTEAVPGVQAAEGERGSPLSPPPAEVTLHAQAKRPARKRLSNPVIAATAVGALVVLGASFVAFKAVLSYQGKPAVQQPAAAEPAKPPAVTGVATPVVSPSPQITPQGSAVAVAPVVSPVINTPAVSVMPPAVAPTIAVLETPRPAVPVLSSPGDAPLPGFPPTPTPDTGQSISALIIGRESDPPGRRVPLTNAGGDPIGSVPSGTRIPRGQFRTIGDRYAVTYGATTGYVQLLDGRYEYAGGGAPARTPVPVADSNVMELVLAGGRTGDVPVYWESGKFLMNQRTGTEVEVLETQETKLRVKLPNGKVGFVFKANVRPRQ